MCENLVLLSKQSDVLRLEGSTRKSWGSSVPHHHQPPRLAQSTYNTESNNNTFAHTNMPFAISVFMRDATDDDSSTEIVVQLPDFQVIVTVPKPDSHDAAVAAMNATAKAAIELVMNRMQRRGETTGEQVNPAEPATPVEDQDTQPTKRAKADEPAEEEAKDQDTQPKKRAKADESAEYRDTQPNKRTKAECE